MCSRVSVRKADSFTDPQPCTTRHNITAQPTLQPQLVHKSTHQQRVQHMLLVQHTQAARMPAVQLTQLCAAQVRSQSLNVGSTAAMDDNSLRSAIYFVTNAKSQAQRQRHLARGAAQNSHERPRETVTLPMTSARKLDDCPRTSDELDDAFLFLACTTLLLDFIVFNTSQL